MINSGFLISFLQLYGYPWVGHFRSDANTHILCRVSPARRHGEENASHRCLRTAQEEETEEESAWRVRIQSKEEGGGPNGTAFNLQNGRRLSMGTELLLKVSAESTSRFRRLLQDLLEEHEKQQSLLRREIQRLGGEAEAAKVLEVLDPERVDLEVPSERREDDVVLALTNEGLPSLDPLPPPKEDESLSDSSPKRSAVAETGSLALPPIPATDSEILRSAIKMDEGDEDGDFKKGIKAVAFSSETSRQNDVQTPKSKASALENKVYVKRDTWAISTFGMEDDWSPQRYIMTSQSTKTMELLPQMNCFSILKHGRPIPPSAPVRLAWDVTGLFLILYDICAIPLEAFEFQRIFFQEFMDWAALAAWSCVAPDYWKIAINYLSTWFILDCAVIIPEWLTMLGSDSFSYAGPLRCSRRGDVSHEFHC
eukprot:s217_g27.t1